MVKTFNQFMHDRNPYKRKPDFNRLSEKYPEFKEIIIEYPNGKLSIDYKNINSLMLLTQILLKEDFSLKVSIPPDRLIPAIPQRLNYLLWVEDIIHNSIDKCQAINGIDIGTGALCIFPLLAVRKNPTWNIIATEIDDYSLNFAQINVKQNNLEDKIKVVKGNKDNLILNLVDNKSYTFLMCNPPFFNKRPTDDYENIVEDCDAKKISTSNTSSCLESVTLGGEVEFVTKLIEESFQLKDKIFFFTVMLGRKQSLKKLHTILTNYKDDNLLTFIETSFYQGKTIRWGLCWTFNKEIKLINIQKKKIDKIKPLCYKVPLTNFLYTYSINNVSKKILDLLDDINIFNRVLIESYKNKRVYKIKAHFNTWSNQRKRRREIKYRNLTQQKNSQSESTKINKRSFHSEQEAEASNSKGNAIEDYLFNMVNKKIKTNESNKERINDIELILNCDLIVKNVGDDIFLEIKSEINPLLKKSAHEIYQFLLNNL